VDVIEVKREGGGTARRVVGSGDGDDDVIEIKEEPVDE
jgi:hypothetical protein